MLTNLFAIVAISLILSVNAHAQSAQSFTLKGTLVPNATVRCESKGFTYLECPVLFKVDFAVIVKEYSNKECVSGVNWGFSERGVWVDKGCRANFQVIPKLRTITCSSYNRETTTCSTGIRNYTGFVARRISSASCQNGKSYYLSRNSITVTNGCRADFIAIEEAD